VSNASAWALLMVAGAANATFGLPMKYVRRWEWENTWAAWSLLALICLPVAMALCCVPSLSAVYGEVGLRATALVFLFGAGWGLAQVLFGKAMHAIGIGLTFSIVLGLSAASGSALPMLKMGSHAAAAGAMMRIGAGLVLVVLGVSVCAEAGRRRERAQVAEAKRSGSFASGLVMALCSGLLASLMNVGIAFGGPLVAQATAHGASQANSVYAIWLPLLAGGAVPNLAYCAYLLSRRKTWSLFRGSGLVANAGLAATMAILWFFSTALYGVAAHALGAWGVVLGWPVFMSVIVIGAGFIGIATGEWRDCGAAPVWFQAAGILLLVLAIVSFSRAQSALQHAEPGSGALLRSAPALLSEAYVR